MIQIGILRFGIIHERIWQLYSVGLIRNNSDRMRIGSGFSIKICAKVALEVYMTTMKMQLLNLCQNKDNDNDL